MGKYNNDGLNFIVGWDGWPFCSVISNLKYLKWSSLFMLFSADKHDRGRTLQKDKGTRFPVLYLSRFVQRQLFVDPQTSIERYALEHGIAVVMPNVNRSFYVDMKHGLNYYTYVSQEIPYIATTYFPYQAKGGQFYCRCLYGWVWSIYDSTEKS